MTVDLIPLLPGEEPEQAITRIYEGGVAIVFDAESTAMRIETMTDQPVRPAPAEAFDAWRAEVLRRLHALHDWDSEVFDGFPHLWSKHFGWQVEVNQDDITLRWRRHVVEPYLDDGDFLAAFEGLRTIIHWPDDYGSYCDLDDPDDRPGLIG